MERLIAQFVAEKLGCTVESLGVVRGFQATIILVGGGLQGHDEAELLADLYEEFSNQYGTNLGMIAFIPTGGMVS